ncbi:hypothetical protein Tco_0573425 [Tanacetum coccineum]
MADHSQKWHDETTSRNIGSSSSKDGLVALVNKLDNLGKDMKKLKKSVHAIQVGCQICEGPHLDKDYPLNEEVKQVEKVRYGEFGRTTPFNGNNWERFHIGPPGYYTKTDNHPQRRQSLKELLAKHQEESARRSTEMEVWIKKLQENVEINTRNQNALLKNLETQIEQLTEELHSRKKKFEQAKVVIVEHKGPSSPKKLTNLHGISFISESQEENTNDQLPTKESNLGHFTLPCTIDQTPNSTVILGRPILATVHAQISVFEKEISVGIGAERFTEALDPDKDPLKRCLDEYNWVFHKEIEQLADEYKIKIGEKGQDLEEIWTKCKRSRCKNKDWWYDYWYEDEEKTELGDIDACGKDWDNLKDFSAKIPNLEAMLWEFLVLIILFPFYFISLMYNRDIVQIKWGDGVELIRDVCSIPIHRGLIQAIPISLPSQLIGEILLDYLGFGSTGGLDLACPIIGLSSQYGIHRVGTLATIKSLKKADSKIYILKCFGRSVPLLHLLRTYTPSGSKPRTVIYRDRTMISKKLLRRVGRRAKFVMAPLIRNFWTSRITWVKRLKLFEYNKGLGNTDLVMEGDKMRLYRKDFLEC